jgi:hypothetical protein
MEWSKEFKNPRSGKNGTSPVVPSGELSGGKKLHVDGNICKGTIGNNIQ